MTAGQQWPWPPLRYHDYFRLVPYFQVAVSEFNCFYNLQGGKAAYKMVSQQKLTKMLDVRAINITSKCVLWNGHPIKVALRELIPHIQTVERAELYTAHRAPGDWSKPHIAYQALWPLPSVH